MEPGNLPVAFLGRTSETIEGLIRFTEAGEHCGTKYRRHVLLATDFLQFLQNFLGLLPFSGLRIDKSQIECCWRGAYENRKRFLALIVGQPLGMGHTTGFRGQSYFTAIEIRPDKSTAGVLCLVTSAIVSG